jgi:hypothetical protein
MKIYQKLLSIQQKINGLGKDKATYNYKYVTGDKLLGEIKPMMNNLGLLLKQEVLSIENTRQDYDTKSGRKSEILSKVMMKFTWIDTETGEKDENLFGANGQNDWEKGLGSALTYAERYFLLKYFHIATDEDDIDNDQRKTSAPVPLKSELNELDWLNLEKIFEDKKEKIDAEKFDSVKKTVEAKNHKYYDYILKYLNSL